MADESAVSRKRSPAGFLGRLDRVLGQISSVGAVISGVLLMAVMLMTIFDILQRKYLPTSVPGIIEISTLLMTFVVYAAIGYAQRTGRHVSMTLVVDRLRPAPARALHTAGMLLALFITGWMVVQTGESAWESYASSEMSYGAVSFTEWPYRAIVCLGLALFFFEMLASVLKGEVTQEENYEETAV
jgi:TRAP-type C4-dicarboxylate transport system permease small subunit